MEKNMYILFGVGSREKVDKKKRKRNRKPLFVCTHPKGRKVTKRRLENIKGKNVVITIEYRVIHNCLADFCARLISSSWWSSSNRLSMGENPPSTNNNIHPEN